MFIQSEYLLVLVIIFRFSSQIDLDLCTHGTIICICMLDKDDKVSIVFSPVQW